MTTRAWHDSHYQHTDKDTHPHRWRHFIEIDPFNPENRVEGYVQMSGGDEYGTLDIQEVNGRPAPQWIIAMPKTACPFFKDGAWVLQDVAKVQAYLKLDGTNICQYAYEDADGAVFTSFKLRTRPFMPPHFLNLLEKVLERYSGVREKKLQPGQCIMYELYGKSNPMIIRYREDIQLALLCGRDGDRGIITLADKTPLFEGIDCPKAPWVPIEAQSDIQAEYRRRQDVYTEEISPATDNMFDGEEGEMLYVTFPDGARSEPGPFTRLIKLKAHQVEEIHWRPDHISRQEAEATARNVFEVADDPTEQDLFQLLAEDWETKQIQRSIDTIRAALAEVLERRRFQDQVLEVYHQHFDEYEFHLNRAGVMRVLSQHFNRADMNRVYSALVERGTGN